MAYRIKGFLTKKQRDGLEGLIDSYFRLINDEDLPQLLRDVAKGAYFPFILLAHCILDRDNMAIIDKALTRAAAPKRRSHDRARSTANP